MKYLGNHKENHKGTIIEYICENHKDKGVLETDWGHFKNSKIGCKYCSGRNRTTEDFINELKDRNITVLSEYTKSEDNVDFLCNICGHKWTTQARTVLSNKSGCPVCGKNKQIKSRLKTQKQFEQELFSANPFIEVKGNYLGTHKKVLCLCKKCNSQWEAYPANLLNNSAGCPKCNLSDGERKLLSFLDSFCINYKTQYIFKDCKDVLPLRFDAYDLDHNIAYEYNGEQHYKQVMLKKHYIDGEELLKIQKRDKIKKQYCQDNNISLIIIPYWEKDNMRNFLLTELNKKGIYY